MESLAAARVPVVCPEPGARKWPRPPFPSRPQRADGQDPRAVRGDQNWGFAFSGRRVSPICGAIFSPQLKTEGQGRWSLRPKLR